MEKNRKLIVLALIVTTGFVAAELRDFIYGFVMGRGYPWNTYLFVPSERFSDYRTLTQACSQLNPYFGSIPQRATSVSKFYGLPVLAVESKIRSSALRVFTNGPVCLVVLPIRRAKGSRTAFKCSGDWCFELSIAIYCGSRKL